MSDPRRSADRDPRAWRPSAGALWLALAAAAGAPLLWWWWSPAPPAAEPPLRAAAPQAVAGDAAPISAPPIDAAPAPAAAPSGPRPAGPAASAAVARAATARTRDPHGDLTPDLSDIVNPGEAPTMAEVISRLHAAGVTSGLGAFSPPGTRPPLIGLAVPEDYALPSGYVRHHQSTDDGQSIEAVLMFAPGFQLYDTAGRPVAMPPDRVVPPELAPPGLPMRRIVVPKPLEPGR